jgi:dihydroorotase
MHAHFRTGTLLQTVVPYTARQFGRAVVMPNTPTPITTTQLAVSYRDDIISAVPNNVDFTPLMMAYLTDTTDADDIAMGFESGVFFGAKLYPANATTNSAFGVTDIKKIDAVLSTMEHIGMPLSVHGEVTDKHIDIFDREAQFVSTVLDYIISTYPNLRITMEHITTQQSVEFLRSAGCNVGATVTPQHLVYNRNDMLVGGIKPHLYCLPIIKREEHRLALCDLVTSGFDRVFLGTDSAPHTRNNKECSCGCAGVFSAMHALEHYVDIFDQYNALNHFEGFATSNANAFHNMTENVGTITLTKRSTDVVQSIGSGDDTLTPMCAGQSLNWGVDYD